MEWSSGSVDYDLFFASAAGILADGRGDVCAVAEAAAVCADSRKDGDESGSAVRDGLVCDQAAGQLGTDHYRVFHLNARRVDHASAAGAAGVIDAGCEAVGRNSCAADYWNAGQRPYAGGDGAPAASGSGDELAVRDYRHYGRADGRHAGCA